MKSILIILLLSTGLSINGFTQDHEILSYFYNVDGRDQIVLKWAVAYGKTCNGIKIFRSDDGVNYTQVGEILGICGSSTEEIPYTFEDKDPVSNQKNYYKLELGLQGSSTPLIITYYNTGENGYLLFPNPGRDLMQIVVTGNGEPIDLLFSDVSGKMIGSFNSSSGEIISVPTQDWIPGVYFISIIKGDELIASPRWVKN